MKCEIVTGNMPQLWEDLLSQLHEKEYPSESIRHYREAMGRVDRYMRENQILEYTEAVGETYLATHGGRISSGRQFYMSFYVRRLNDILNKRPYPTPLFHRFPWRRFYAKLNLDPDRAATIPRQVHNRRYYPTSHHNMAHKRTVQMIPALRFSGAGISNNFLPNSCSCATIQVSSYALKEV